MNEAIKNIYYGNIVPCETLYPNKIYIEISNQAFNLTEKLKLSLSGEQSELLNRILKMHQDAASLLAEQSFIDGFKLGAKLLKESLDE